MKKNDFRNVTLTLTRCQVASLLALTSTMGEYFGSLDGGEILELYDRIKVQLDLFDHDELCREIRLKSYMPYVRLVDRFCSIMFVAPTLGLLCDFRRDAYAKLNTWVTLPDNVYAFLHRKIRLSFLSASRRLRHSRKLH